jgi:hypothetical protein
MTRRVVFIACLLLFSAGVTFAGVVVMQRAAIAAGSYNPVTDDDYRGNVEGYTSGLFRQFLVASAIAAGSGIAAILARPQRPASPR